MHATAHPVPDVDPPGCSSRSTSSTAGRVDLDRLVTGTYDLADAAQALTASRRDRTAVEAVVRPGR